MNAIAAKAYKQVAVETSVLDNDPHRMILMLYDGALESVRRAAVFLREGRPAEKGRLLGRALRIVDEGLKASLDRKVGGALAQDLAALYDYLSLRLLQANLRNDAQALAEVERLLAELRSAWAQIGLSPSVVVGGTPASPAANARSEPVPVRAFAAEPAPRTGFTVHA
jgi:flagellar protein FliS